MKSWEKIPLVDYTKKEEFLHTLTHALGLILSVFIIYFCLIPSIEKHDVLRIICASLYLFGNSIMFLTSAVYHGAKNKDRKKMLRLLDHCMIFFSVAGNATACVPLVSEIVSKTAGALMAACAWTGAITGLMLTFLSFEKTKAIQMCLYIGTGLVCAISGAKAFKILPKGAFLSLLLGGTFLLSGAVLYGIGKRKRYFHAIFHVFIDIGLTIFFIGIERYCF